MRMCFAAALLATVSLASVAQAQERFEVVLAPGPLAADAEQGHLDVTLKLSGVDAAAGQPLLALPVVIANTATVATTLQNLRATDAAGEVPLSFKDDPVAIAYARHWIPGRAVKGDLTISSPTSPRGNSVPSSPTTLSSAPGTARPALRIRWLPSSTWSAGGSTAMVPVVSVMP